MDIKLLAPPADPAFLPMTFPAYRHLLTVEVGPKLLGEAGSPPVQPVALGAFLASEAVGLALLALPLGERETAELLSVYVVGEHRGKGWGKKLVQAAETVASNAGFANLGVVWTEGGSGSQWWAKVSQELGWGPPERRTLSVLFTAQEAPRFPWLDRFPVREGCEIVPFVSVTREEMEALKVSQEKSPWIAPDLVPWRYVEEGFEERTSVALRAPEGIMGWVINHALSAQWLRFTCSFIRKDWGRRGRILPLFSESIHRMVEAGFTMASFVAPVRHPTMVQFVEKHMAPWAQQARWTLGSTKKLQHQPQWVTRAG
uniref:GNAT family N-acetyltransferase n=1 Tax=Thermoanaerobaculum aquaticum TaxID=1312852 RepID=A0A7V1ZHV2_9BACT